LSQKRNAVKEFVQTLIGIVNVCEKIFHSYSAWIPDPLSSFK